MYIYHALINALSAHMKHINLNMIFCTYVEHSPTKQIKVLPLLLFHTELTQIFSHFSSSHGRLLLLAKELLA